MILTVGATDHTQNRANIRMFTINFDTFYVIKCHRTHTIRHTYHVRMIHDNDF